MENLKFQEMNLSEEAIKAIEDMGFEEATPIQSKSIEVILDGRDVLGQSQTGTGKTAAFGIPCLEKIDKDDRRLQALILCPTRELAIQVSEEFRKLLKYKGEIKVLPIYGGQPIERQIMALKKGVQVVIGTPGRVMDHMNRHTLRTDNVRMVILDEADEMLDMGFREDIETILAQTPEDRQMIMFSATMPRAILELTRKFQNDPVEIKVVRKELTVPSIEQSYFEVKEYNKVEALCRLIDLHNPDLSLVFCNTKRKVDELVETLQSRGYFAEGLHGDLKQQQRDMVMKKFRNRTLQILVATDVAARGIDVDDIDIVVNYDLPQDEEYYIHRIGRTGRAGRSGRAFTFVSGREIYKLRDIMRYTKAKVKLEKLPSIHDIEEVKSKAFVEEIKNTINQGQLSKYITLAESITETSDITTLDIAAALLKMHLYDENKVEIDFEKDSFVERSRSSFNDKSKGKVSKDKKSRPGMIRMFINAGEQQKVRKKDVVGALANESGIPGKEIGSIDIFSNFTFFDVPEKYVKQIIKTMKNTKIKGTKVNIEQAKKSKK